MVVSSTRIDKFWHGALKRPYKLVRSIDQGSGPLVILLHGLGMSGQVWQPLAKELQNEKLHVVALDLLGFGSSPKPVWPDYSMDDHARAIITAIKKMRPREPVILVGHSLGCLLATHIAWREPKLIKQLLLYEMPLYASEVINSRSYKLHQKVLFSFYRWVVQDPERTTKLAIRLGSAATRLRVKTFVPSTTRPYLKTLQNTIMQQKTYNELFQLELPIHIVSGTRDPLVIRASMKKLFRARAHVSFHALKETHSVSVKASKYLANKIIEISTLPAERYAR